MRQYFISLLLLVSVLQGQMMRPTNFTMDPDTVYSGLIGSSISDIVGQGNTLWLGSGHGLSATFDNGQSFIAYSRQFSDLGKGGVSALASYGDTVWVAMGYDTTTALGDLKTGGGISRSLDGGASWSWLGQPMDTLTYTYTGNDSSADTYSQMAVFGETILSVDVVTPIQNITYDLAFDGFRLWATSFGGGLRVSHDLGDTWQRVLLPWDDFDRLDSALISDLAEEIEANPQYYALDPLLHFNHIAFAVKAWGDTVWVGTSGGINRSLDGGASWEHFTFQNSNISGNWVIALNRQQFEDGSERIWASTITTGAGDVTGLSYFDEEIHYWRATNIGYRSWNLASDNHTIYSATDQGLWKSKDALHFERLPGYSSTDGHSNIYSDAVYSVLVNEDGAVWVGTGDGLAVSYNNGLSWEINKAQNVDDQDQVYAYPNPFTPRSDKVLNGMGNLIIHYSAESGSNINIQVFDFAMHKVREVYDGSTAQDGPQERTWNGRNEVGYLVANGTYFIRVSVGDKTEWTKVMVIN